MKLILVGVLIVLLTGVLADRVCVKRPALRAEDVVMLKLDAKNLTADRMARKEK